MNEHEPPETLSKEAVRAIRRELRKDASVVNKVVSRIGRVVSYPQHPDGDVRRYRFGIGMIAVAILVAVTVWILPRKEGTWLFLAFAWLLAGVGAWHIDKAQRKR